MRAFFRLIIIKSPIDTSETDAERAKLESSEMIADGSNKII